MRTRFIFTSILLLLIFTACEQSINTKEQATTKASQEIEINPDSIRIDGDLGKFNVERTAKTIEDGVQLITFKFTSEKAAELNPVTLVFNFPSVDINAYWSPIITIDKVNYWSNRFSSKASRYAPVFSWYNNELTNRITIALSDALNMSEFSGYVREEDVNFYPRIQLFKERIPKTKSYEVTLRIDTRAVKYHKSLDAVAQWWADMPENKPMFVPESAKEPMYSTWYSYHQNITAKEIFEECKIAKSLGCEAVIVDDGWQTNDGNRGYAYTGDWNPDRIADMKGFVDSVHALDMNFILWYSLPFMGENAKNYKRFKGKYLRYWDGQGTYVMDPRYPEVREYIINTYIEAMDKWNVDGFKLDFIGRFTAVEDTKLTKANGRDFASVNEATDFLMTEITNRLTAIKPDILIEFRQPYIGPLMRKYGNMFRGVDCPNNAVANRIETVNLRILSQNTAVHSDMFIWRQEEPVESAALQILNILYSVPQLSVRLNEIPDDHLDMIRYWFKYWNENKSILLDAEFTPSNPASNYPVLTASDGTKQITTLYEDHILRINEIEELDIINAKGNPSIIMSLNKKFNGTIVITDCEGNIIQEENSGLGTGLHEFNIPLSGMITFKAN